MTALDRLRHRLAAEPAHPPFVGFVSAPRQESEDSLWRRSSTKGSSEQLTNYLENEKVHSGQEPKISISGNTGTDKTDKRSLRWIDRQDVIATVEDLADEGMRPGRIARTLGLRRAEVVTVLRRIGR
jgi:hypothetical protein